MIDINNPAETPDKFKGYVFRGRIYFTKKRPEMWDDSVIWPQPLRTSKLLESLIHLEGLMECFMDNGIAEPRLRWEKIR